MHLYLDASALMRLIAWEHPSDAVGERVRHQ